MLLCGGGAAWSVGYDRGDPPRFIPAGIAGCGGSTGAPVQAAACGPGGLIVLAHEAVGAGARATLSVWSAPALGLQTPSRLATVTCDREIRGGAATVGFAGGQGAPFVWVAERERSGSAVYAYDWRVRSKATTGGGRDGGGVDGGGGGGGDGGGAGAGAAIAWVPGGAGRRVACVTADGAGCDIAACGTSFLCFLTLERVGNAADGRPEEAHRAGDDDR